MVAKIATGEIEEKTSPVYMQKKKGGLIGGKARAKKLPSKKRKEIAQIAARARWGKK